MVDCFVLFPFLFISSVLFLFFTSYSFYCLFSFFCFDLCRRLLSPFNEVSCLHNCFSQCLVLSLFFFSVSSCLLLFVIVFVCSVLLTSIVFRSSSHRRHRSPLICCLLVVSFVLLFFPHLLYSINFFQYEIPFLFLCSHRTVFLFRRCSFPASSVLSNSHGFDIGIGDYVKTVLTVQQNLYDTNSYVLPYSLDLVYSLFPHYIVLLLNVRYPQWMPLTHPFQCTKILLLY